MCLKTVAYFAVFFQCFSFDVALSSCLTCYKTLLTLIEMGIYCFSFCELIVSRFLKGPHFIYLFIYIYGLGGERQEIRERFSVSIRIKENRYKLVNRCCYTPSRLAKMNQKASFWHIWWPCEKIKVFWKASQQILGRIMPFHPRLLLFGGKIINV